MKRRINRGRSNAWDNTRAYVSPRFFYSRNTTSADTGTTAKVYSLSGSVGGEHSFAKHFGVYGELGLTYARQTTSFSSTFVVSDTNTNAWTTRSAVGAILYF